MPTLAANPAPTSPKPWIVSAWWDLTYVVVTPLLIVPVVLILVRNWLTPEQVALAVIAFASIGHHLPGFMRAYGDKELFHRYKFRFLLTPPLFLAIALLFTPPSSVANLLNLPWEHLHGLELMLLVWGTWHGLMQTYGFMRIYDVRRGIFDRWTARLDHWLCVIVFAIGVVFSDARVFAISKGMWESGLPLFGPEWLVGLRWSVGGLAAVIAAAYVVNLVQQHRRGVKVSGVKLLLIATTGWFYWYTGRLSVNVLIGIAMFEIYHAVQYYAIVWIYNKRLLHRAKGRFGPLGFLFQDRWTMLAIYFAAIAAYSSVRYFSLDINEYGLGVGRADAHQWLLALFVTSSFLHFYYDGFIWRVSERKTQENLVDVTHSNAPPVYLVPAAVHLAKWVLLLGIIGGLLSSEWNRLPESSTTEAERLRALAALTPNLPECQSLLCRDALERGNSREAIIHGKKALELRPGSHASHADLGLAYLIAGRLEEAKQSFQRAIELAPQEWAYHIDLGLVLSRLGHPHSAEVALLEAVRLQPELQEPRERLADFYFTMGRFEQAAEQFALIRERFPESLAAEIGEVLLWSGQGKHPEAVRLAQYLAAGNPHNWRVLFSLGVSLSASGDHEAALIPLQKASRLRPRSPDIQYHLALVYFQLQDFTAARSILQNSLAVDPQHFRSHFQLGNTHYVLGDYTAALQAYRHAHLLRPNDPELCANMGGLLAQMGYFDQAEKVYRQGLIEQEYPQLYFNLGILLWQEGDVDEASELILRARELGMEIPAEVLTAINAK